MELKWIDDFLALVQTRNFTHAAEIRHTTQSAYSRRIARLEDWIGTELFIRSTRPVSLTPQGIEFLNRAKLLKADIMDAQRAVQVLDSHLTHAVRIYTTNTLAVGFLPDILPSLQSRYMPNPLSILVASVTGCYEAINSGKANAILVPVFNDDTDLASPDLSCETVGQDYLSLMASEPVTKTIRLHRKNLQGAVMMYPPSVRYGQIAQGILTARGITLGNAPVCESASAESLVALAKAGFGAAFVPCVLGKPAGLVDCQPRLVAPYSIVLISK